VQPRFQQVFDAAVGAGGHIGAMMRVLGIGPVTLGHRLSILRSQGLARSVRTFDPGALGRPHQSICLVSLRLSWPDAIATFEAACKADDAVTAAARICGRFDYQLTTFHSDVRAAHAWRRAMEERPEVHRVEQRSVRLLFGHDLLGLPLVSGSRRSRADPATPRASYVGERPPPGERAPTPMSDRAPPPADLPGEPSNESHPRN
jgi:hypothetical protein